MSAAASLTFEGCKTRADAELHFRHWLEEMHRDQMRDLQSSVLARDLGDDLLDVDSLDDGLEVAQEIYADGVETAVAQFNRLMDRFTWPDQPPQ